MRFLEVKDVMKWEQGYKVKAEARLEVPLNNLPDVTARRDLTYRIKLGNEIQYHIYREYDKEK